MLHTINAARTLVVNFTRVSLGGEVPPAAAGTDDYVAVADALTRDDVFRAQDVACWPASRRRALFEMLAAAIVALRMGAPGALDPAAFAGSTPCAVTRGFGRWLAALPFRRHRRESGLFAAAA